jgi:adenine/guanine phosphoribosyltransferase-like PRPP-binding protein
MLNVWWNSVGDYKQEEFENILRNKIITPINRGIIIGMLINYKNNILQPFLPLQRNSKSKEDKVMEIYKEWGQETLDILQRNNKYNN